MKEPLSRKKRILSYELVCPICDEFHQPIIIINDGEAREKYGITERVCTSCFNTYKLEEDK